MKVRNSFKYQKLKEFTISRLQKKKKKKKKPKQYPSSRMKIVLIGCSDMQEGMEKCERG